MQHTVTIKEVDDGDDRRAALRKLATAIDSNSVSNRVSNSVSNNVSNSVSNSDGHIDKQQ